MERESVTGVLIPLNQKNLNGRIYIDNENLRENIDKFNKRVNDLGVVYGEYGYPEHFDTTLSKVSHTIKNVRIEGDNVVGEIVPVNTRYGKILQDELDDMVFRPRSAGVIDGNGMVTIKKLFTFDAVRKSEDAFNMENQGKKQIVHERVYSMLDPYGEENWE